MYSQDTYPKAHVVIPGHAINEGHKHLNENLARLRSHDVKVYLQANRIADERVIVRSRGEHFPKFKESKEDYRIRNRRIELDFSIPKYNK